MSNLLEHILWAKCWRTEKGASTLTSQTVCAINYRLILQNSWKTIRGALAQWFSPPWDHFTDTGMNRVIIEHVPWYHGTTVWCLLMLSGVHFVVLNWDRSKYVRPGLMVSLPWGLAHHSTMDQNISVLLILVLVQQVPVGRGISGVGAEQLHQKVHLCGNNFRFC